MIDKRDPLCYRLLHMEHDISLIANIAIAIVAAFVGGLLARRFGMPTIVGYLFAGMAIGPFTPGFVGDVGEISQLAELGVIFLMFGVGLQFSLKDLWAVRRVAIPGAILQMITVVALGFGLTQAWGWSFGASLVFGLSLSISSTVVLMRGLMDNGLLKTDAGRVVVGWTVLEDLATVLILVLLPALVISGSTDGSSWVAITTALLKAAAFIGLMLFVGARVMPWLMIRIARTRSRELFILAAVAVSLGIAFGAATLFGVSLALGAFLAGVVLGESEVGLQVGNEVLPFRETFAVIFFVSVGMLVNPLYLLNHAGDVLLVTTLIVVGRAIIALSLGLILPVSGRIALVVAAGLSQIGEFAFIVGQAGVMLGVLSSDQYALVLAGALLSIMVNPLMFRAIPHAERFLQRIPAFWALLDRHPPPPDPLAKSVTEHVVVVGYGRVGEHIINVLKHLGVPHLVVEIDARRAAEFEARGVPTLYGDAANSEVLTHARLEQARALVVTLPDEAASEIVVAAAHDLAPHLPVIARAATTSGIERLTHLGARDVIHPELEGGLEVMRHTLLSLGYPAGEVQRYADAVRRDRYDTSISTPEEQQVLEQLLRTVRGMEIAWLTVEHTSLIVGLSLAEANLRARTGASVIALIRAKHLIANPKSSTTFQVGDLVGVIGDAEQLSALTLVLQGQPVAQRVDDNADGVTV